MAVDAQRGTTPWEDVEAAIAAALDAPARRPADPGLGGSIEAVAYWSFEPSLEIVVARAERPSDAQAVAIDYAFAAVEEAEYAVLDADLARMDAEELEAGAQATA